MNLIDCYVTEVLTAPRLEFGFWIVRVSFDSHGRISETELCFPTISAAEGVSPGYKFLS